MQLHTSMVRAISAVPGWGLRCPEAHVLCCLHLAPLHASPHPLCESLLEYFWRSCGCKGGLACKAQHPESRRALQVLKRRARGFLLQYMGAHREVTVDGAAAAHLAHLMPPPLVVDTSKVLPLQACVSCSAPFPSVNSLEGNAPHFAGLPGGGS